MSRVCYGKSFTAVVYSHLSRKGKDAGWQGVFVQLDSHCVSLQQTTLAIIMKGAGSEKHQPVKVAFAHQGEEQVATWSKQDQRGPAGDLQFMPQRCLAVVYHRVGNVVAEHGTSDVVQDL